MAGFAQSQNQLAPSYYVVTINCSNATRWPDDTTERNGRIHVQDYSAYDTEAHPISDVNQEKIARGHLRFKFCVEELVKYSDAQIIAISFNSSDKENGNNKPTQAKFTVRYERDDNVLPSTRAEVYEKNQNYNTFNGSEITTTELAIHHLVVQGITRGNTEGYTRRANVGQNHRQVTVKQPSAPTGIFSDVTVTRLSEADLIKL